MSDDSKCLLGLFSAVAILGSSIAWSMAWYFTTTDKAAIEAGLEQRTLPGQTGVYWVRPGEQVKE